MPLNFHNQGGDVGLYGNDEIHAIRILAMEPTTDRKEGPRNGRLFYSHASERLRILGEIPVRKFEGDRQPTDPDGNPDTSFLARIPADTAFTFQTLDVNGLVLNVSQTWHQVRPGEIRNNCGGCHAHSQAPTDFSKTMAARPEYKVWDLVQSTPLVATKPAGAGGPKFDARGDTTLVERKGPVTAEYFRDIQPILKRSCAACHSKASEKPAAGLVLDADDDLVPVEQHGKLPGTYVRLALDERAKFGIKPVGYDSWGYPNASRYIRKLQARRSLLAWKLFGRRLDGFSNDDHPSETEPGSGVLAQKGEKVDREKNRSRWDLDFVGSIMPPAEAVAGTYAGPEGKPIRVAPLTDEDCRTILRWIDLGCPIDLDRRENPESRSYGWMCDDNRPILTLTLPTPGRILVGMWDYYSGIDPESFRVTVDVDVEGQKAGENLAPRFRPISTGVYELKLATPPGRITVSVKDRQGNLSRIDRTIRP
jgi:hypothetical protein